MLTKDDLKQIGNVIDERLDEKLEPIKKVLTTLKKDVSYLRKATSIIAKNYVEGDVKLNRRVTRIEKHLNLPKN